MKITDQQLERLEQLAGLNVSEEERGKMETQIAKLLTYMCVLEDVGDGKEMPALENVMRDDELGPSFPREEILKNAQGSDGEMFPVTRTVD